MTGTRCSREKQGSEIAPVESSLFQKTGYRTDRIFAFAVIWVVEMAEQLFKFWEKCFEFAPLAVAHIWASASPRLASGDPSVMPLIVGP